MDVNIKKALCHHDTMSRLPERIVQILRLNEKGRYETENAIISTSPVVIDPSDGSYKSVKPRKKRESRKSLPQSEQSHDEKQQVVNKFYH
jgi:hypothetical protein